MRIASTLADPSANVKHAVDSATTSAVSKRIERSMYIPKAMRHELSKILQSSRDEDLDSNLDTLESDVDPNTPLTVRRRVSNSIPRSPAAKLIRTSPNGIYARAVGGDTPDTH